MIDRAEKKNLEGENRWNLQRAHPNRFLDKETPMGEPSDMFLVSHLRVWVCHELRPAINSHLLTPVQRERNDALSMQPRSTLNPLYPKINLLLGSFLRSCAAWCSGNSSRAANEATFQAPGQLQATATILTLGYTDASHYTDRVWSERLPLQWPIESLPCTG